MIGLVLLALLALSRPDCSNSQVIEEPVDSIDGVDLETLEHPVLVRSCDLDLESAPGVDCTDETNTENLDCDASRPEALTQDCKSLCKPPQDPHDVPENICLPDTPDDADDQDAYLVKPIGCKDSGRYEWTTNMGVPQIWGCDKMYDKGTSTDVFVNNTCFHDSQPANTGGGWAEVTLSGYHNIVEVQILNRNDSSPWRLARVRVEVCMGDNCLICGHVSSDLQQDWNTVRCGSVIRGNSVRFSNPWATLTICEIEILATTKPYIVMPNGCSESGRLTDSWGCEKMYDGGNETANPSCFHDSQPSNTGGGWAEVTLSGDHNIVEVQILNRGDCCSERLAEVGVEVCQRDSCWICGNVSSIPQQGWNIVHCGSVLRGSSVRFSNHLATLTICEIKILATPTLERQCDPTQKIGSCVVPEDAIRIPLGDYEVNECESKCREVFSTSGEVHGCEWKREEWNGTNVCAAIISPESIGVNKPATVNKAAEERAVCIPIVVPWGGFSFCQARLYRRYFGFKRNGYKCIPKKGWPMIFSYCIGNCFSSSTLGFPASEPEDRDCKCCSPWQMFRTWTFFTCYTPDEGPALTLFYPYSFISRCNCNTCVGVRGISDIELDPPVFGEKHAQETITAPSTTEGRQ